MATASKKISRVRIVSDTFIGGVPVSAGATVPNDKVTATEAQMLDLVLYRKAVDISGQAPAGKEK